MTLKLNNSISRIPGIGPTYENLFHNLEIYTIKDLLEHLPSRLEKFSTHKKIGDLKPGEQTIFEAELFSIENIRTTLYKVDKIDKPIRSLSYYKVEELVAICCKLAIETCHLNTGKTKSKKDLYEAIIQYF
jgi:RecG-like helicase